MSHSRHAARWLAAFFLASCTASPPMPDPPSDHPASVKSESSPRAPRSEALSIPDPENKR